MWMWQTLTGAFLLVFLGIHMFAQHFVADVGLRTYDDVISYMQNPLVFSVEVVFLIVVTIHALMGVRAIILDLGISDTADRRLKQGLIVLGIAMVGYGIWLSFNIIS